MDKLKLFLDEWFSSKIVNLIKRDIVTFDFPEGMGMAIAGVRRSGKTFVLFEMAEKLRKLYPVYNVVYINFEDDRLLPLNGNELKNLFSVLKQNFPINKESPIWFLLDEVQLIPEWEKYLRSFIDRRIARIIFTGSSKELTIKNLPSKLAGRVISKIIFPLSFREFLRFRDFTLDMRELKYSKHDELMYLFNEYLEYGGFPEVVLSKDKKEVLSSYFLTIFYRDMVEKFSVRKIEEFEIFLRLTFRQIGSLMSLKNTINFMRSIGFKLSKNTALEYLEYAQNAFLIYPVEIFSYKLKDRMQYPKKIYCVDTGIVNLGIFRLKRDYGNLLENAVFMELLRRKENIFYWKNERGEEVDFVILENFKPVELIQVCYNIEEEKTKKREIKALLKAMDEFKLKKGLIITKDFLGEEKINNKKVIYRPFWLWALKNE